MVKLAVSSVSSNGLPAVEGLVIRYHHRPYTLSVFCSFWTSPPSCTPPLPHVVPHLLLHSSPISMLRTPGPPCFHPCLYMCLSRSLFVATHYLAWLRCNRLGCNGLPRLLPVTVFPFILSIETPGACETASSSLSHIAHNQQATDAEAEVRR